MRHYDFAGKPQEIFRSSKDISDLPHPIDARSPSDVDLKLRDLPVIAKNIFQDGQTLAEDAHDRTKEDMLRLHGGRMTEEQVAYLQSAETKGALKVYSAKEYKALFPEMDDNVLGHCDALGRICIKNVSKGTVSHISTHETMHLCANRELQANESGGFQSISGVHDVAVSSDDEVLWDKNRGINEGITEMYTLRELTARGESQAAESVNAYSEARIWAERLENLVGPDAVADAYFDHGGEKLQEEISRLDPEHENAWDHFSSNVDKLEYGATQDEMEEAYQDLTSQYITMLLNSTEAA